jgi:single-stranded-DNA-specific exonuclease
MSKWILPQNDRELSGEISRALGIPLAVADVLRNRGAESVEEALLFLEPPSDITNDPHELTDFDRAISELLERRDRGKVLVWGHDDVDGISATTLLVEACRLCGIEAEYYIPNRTTEGYGIFVDKVFSRGHSILVVTVDTGISEARSVRDLSEAGVNCVITDHHEVPAELPDAEAVVNPKRADSSYPFKELAGAGVAYLVARELLSSTGKRHEDLIALSSLGTLSDRVPLVGDNRIIVSNGFRNLAHSNRPALVLLRNFVEWETCTESTNLWRKVNSVIASGDSNEGVNPGCELLLADRVETADELLQALAVKREEREVIRKKAWNMVTEATEEIRHSEDEGLLLLTFPDMPFRIAGYCSSRLLEETGRPNIIIVGHGDVLTAEARSHDGFDLVKAFNSMAGMFVKYGGHKKAAGFSIRTENVEEFKETIAEYAQGKVEQIKTQVDTVLDLTAITSELSSAFERLGPFGEGNPRPVVATQVLADTSVIHELAREGKYGLTWEPLAEPTEDTGRAVIRFTSLGRVSVIGYI